ncbi:hypothetical protein ABPG73_021253 [Tetrahymena malaccensis]
MMNTKLIITLVFGLIFCYTPVYCNKTCAIGTYYNELNESCDDCFVGCSKCTGYQQKDCQDCLSYYQKIQLTNQFICSLCPQGQFFDNQQNKCINCKFDCQICVSLSKCLVCKQGYVYDLTKKDTCNTIDCAFGYFRNPMTQQCQQCTLQIPNSLDCYIFYLYKDQNGNITSFSLKPSICFDSFQLNQYQCSCSVNVFSSNNKCISCTDPNCFICSNSSTCSQCKTGYILNYFTSQCVLQCDQTLYQMQYIDPSNIYCTQGKVLVQQNNKSYCKQFLGYDSDYGCFNQFCKPLQLKLFDPQSNSFRCVSACPIGYTANLQTFSCIKNDCSNDISQQINGTCFYRTCPFGYYFSQFKDLMNLSQCQPVDNSGCLFQLDESTSCLFCQIQFIMNSSNCVTNCQADDLISNYAYYQDKGQCQSCYMPYCSSSNFQYTYVVNNVSYKGSNCPYNYQTNNKECIKCSNPNMIKCDTPATTTYLCDWGEDNQTSDCQKHDLTKLTQKSFDSYGNILNFSNCQQQDPSTKLCLICYTQYNFKGICSYQFLYPTKYFLYQDLSSNSQQYLVLDSCKPNQFVLKVYINSVYMNVCKDFAYCLQSKSQDGLKDQVCDKCPTNFFNIFGSCIDSCPKYTFTNKSQMACETPIQYCALYHSSQTQALCIKCLGGYVLYKNNPSDTCIPYQDCKNGYYYDLNLSYCKSCQINCDECLSNMKCTKPSMGYFLYNYKPIQECPQTTYLSNNTCYDCGQFCLKCIDQNTCQTPYNGSYFYLLSTKVYVFLNLVCNTNQFFDEGQGVCQNCDTSCSQCYKLATQCLLCSDSTMNLLNYECIKDCPTGYYSQLVITTNYQRKMCLKCDSICLDCQNSPTFCLTGCIGNYYFYKNQCLQQCPQNYTPINGICQLNCSSNKNYDPSSDLCCDLNCVKCTQTQCTQCLSTNMYLNQFDPNQCVQTSDQNCLQTDMLNGNCIKCKDGYEYDLQKKICIYFIQKCSIYDQYDQTKCSQCQQGYYLTDQNTCCGIQNCKTCQNNNISVCDICKKMYLLDQNNNCIFDCQVQNCQTCVLNNQQKCEKCISTYKIDPISQQCIFDCQVQNCQICINNNQQQCSTCISNYKVDQSTLQCILDCQVANCQTCQIGNQQKCQICERMYKLDQDNNCVFDCKVENCLICVQGDQEQCLLCQLAYKFDHISKKCKFNCLVQNCQYCIENQQQQCSVCLPGYKVDNYLQCSLDCKVQNCQQCVSDNQYQCDSCLNFYKLDPISLQCDFDCLVPNCQTCQPGNQKKCDKCLAQFKLDDNHQCLFDCQVQNCKQCKQSQQNECESCLSNYSLDSNNKCVFQCQVENCQTCVFNYPKKCSTCEQNYQLDSNQQCKLVCLVLNCQQCMINNPLACQNCIQNYLPDKNSSNCICQVQNCQKCMINDGRQCEICIDKYKLDEKNECIFDCQVLNCQFCALGKQDSCQICLPNFILDYKNNCISNCLIKNCNICKKNNPNLCQFCNENYFLDQNGQCISSCQIQNCQICSNFNSCHKCQYGYKLNAKNQCELECEDYDEKCFQNKQKQQESSEIATPIISGLVGFAFYGIFLFAPIYIISFYDFLQTVNFLEYVNVNFPTSLYTFLKLFGFSNFEFLPRIKSENANVPYTFGREKFDSNFYTIVFLTFYKVNLSAQLQIYGRSSDSIGVLQIIISFLILSLQIISVLLGLQLIKSHTVSNHAKESVIQKLAEKFQQFTKKLFAKRYYFFNGIMLLRRMLYVTTLIYLQDDKVAQIILIQAIFSIQTLLILINKPFPNIQQNNAIIFCHFCFLLSVLCINGLAYDDITNIFSSQMREIIAAITIIRISYQALTEKVKALKNI